MDLPRVMGYGLGMADGARHGRGVNLEAAGAKLEPTWNQLREPKRSPQWGSQWV